MLNPKSTQINPNQRECRYVQLTMDGDDINLCSTCLVNWSDYRCYTAATTGLFEVDDPNEELCALCSDLPLGLVICT